MEPWLKRTLVALAVFIVLSPLGILFTWDYGDAWGEWGEVKLPNGKVWTPKSYFNAPLPDYNVEGWEDKLMASIGYWISAVIGVAATMLMSLGVVKTIELWRSEEGK